MLDRWAGAEVLKSRSNAKGIVTMKNHWQFQDVKNQFSQLVHRAQNNGPQVVTKHGVDAVVVLFSA